MDESIYMKNIQLKRIQGQSLILTERLRMESCLGVIWSNLLLKVAPAFIRLLRALSREDLKVSQDSYRNLTKPVSMFDYPHCEKHALNVYSEFLWLHCASIASCPPAIDFPGYSFA